MSKTKVKRSQIDLVYIPQDDDGGWGDNCHHVRQDAQAQVNAFAIEQCRRRYPDATIACLHSADVGTEIAAHSYRHARSCPKDIWEAAWDSVDYLDCLVCEIRGIAEEHGVEVAWVRTNAVDADEWVYCGPDDNPEGVDISDTVVDLDDDGAVETATKLIQQAAIQARRDRVSSLPASLPGYGPALVAGYVEGEVPGYILADWLEDYGYPALDGLREDEEEDN